MGINYYLNQTKVPPSIDNEPKIEKEKSIPSEMKTRTKQKDSWKECANYFDYLYSYPPKIRLKWDVLDELKGDHFTRSDSNLHNSNFPFKDSIDDWSFTNHLENGSSKTKAKGQPENYSSSQYYDGFKDKINSSDFFIKKTKPIQKALANIPVFVIRNGQGDIVLSKPSNKYNTFGLPVSKTVSDRFDETLYDSCGAFDPLVEKKAKLGLFFLSYSDAERYLKEILQTDSKGTYLIGVNIHCISLDSAYKVTREHHPGTDFRFVPDYTEVKELLNNVERSDLIIEDEQQQLRFRNRTATISPFLSKIGYPFSGLSFLQNNEYFKGVPIYIVQLTEKPRGVWSERYFNTIGKLDTIYNGTLQKLDKKIGFGHNWILQGSLENAGNSDNFENYIFFEKSQATKFCKQNGKKVFRYKGGHTPNIESLIRKPKVLVYNLEDFLEDWEDNIVKEIYNVDNNVKTLFNCKATHFISPVINSEIINNTSKVGPFKKFSQFANLKFHIFRYAIEVFFSLP